MFLLKIFYKTIVDALFPLSEAEQKLFSMSPQEASRSLPPAPDFSRLAVPLPGAKSVFAYKDERVAKLVWNIKYKKSAQAVKVGGYALFQALNVWVGSARRFVRDTPSASTEAAAGSRTPSRPPKRPSESRAEPTYSINAIIIPTPITAQRRRERGYNQCELLLEEMERLAEKELAGSDALFIFEKNLLIRTQHATRQTLKGRGDRVESAKGVFGVSTEVIERLQIKILKDSGTTIEKISVIIIDDVITTGSTMHEAIETLKKLGFEDVRALSLAH
jgi:hypothetical protein